jgi:low affinity Fe/Cu permease
MAMSLLNGMHVKGHRAGGACPAYRCDHFERMSIWTVRAAGCRWGFRLAVLLIVAWAAAGPFFRYHESWTTLFTVITGSVTFLLVFLIQSAQNRESKAVHLKLDELIFSAKHARNELIHIEHLTEEQLDLLGERYSKVAAMHQKALRRSVAESIPVGDATDRSVDQSHEHQCERRWS